MISSLSRITLPSDASPEMANLCQQFNNMLAELELQLASIQGSDGQRATISSDLDMGGFRLKNAGLPGGNSDIISQEALKQKSVYRSNSSRTLSISNAHMASTQIPGAKNFSQPATLEQVIAGSAGAITTLTGATNEIAVSGSGVARVISGGGTDGITTDLITALQVGGGGTLGFQYKKRQFVFHKGIATIGVESAWIDL